MCMCVRVHKHICLHFGISPVIYAWQLSYATATCLHFDRVSLNFVGTKTKYAFAHQTTYEWWSGGRQDNGVPLRV